jgi:hypothetical protein
MTEHQNSSNRTILWIIIAVVAILMLCCCIVIAAIGSFLIVSSESSQDQIIITPIPVTEQPGTGPITIQSFTVDPTRIQSGQCVIFNWSVQGADIVHLLRDDVVIAEDNGLTDSFKDCLDQAGIYRYRLEASNTDGFYQWMELQVIVD